MYCLPQIRGRPIIRTDLQNPNNVWMWPWVGGSAQIIGRSLTTISSNVHVLTGIHETQDKTKLGNI